MNSLRHQKTRSRSAKVGLVRSGQVKNYAELARLGGVSRARVTQVLNLRNLAPAIQERLLFFEGEAGAIHERALRGVAQIVHWEEQQRRFEQLVGAAGRGSEWMRYGSPSVRLEQRICEGMG
jgi:hypothetical protein